MCTQVRKHLMFGYRSGNVEWHILTPGLSWPSINTLAGSPLLSDVEFLKNKS